MILVIIRMKVLSEKRNELSETFVSLIGSIRTVKRYKRCDYPWAGGGTLLGAIIASAGATFSGSGNVRITTLNFRALDVNAPIAMANTHINAPTP